MKNITRRTGAVAAVALSALLLAACGGDGTPDAAPTPDNGATEPAPENGNGDGESNCSTDAPCEITFRWWGNEGRAAMTQEVVDLFMEQNPDIVVHTEPGSFDGFFTGLGAEMAAQNAPDLIQLNDSWPIEYGGRGGMIDLRTLDQWLDLAPFSQAALAPSTAPGGEVFAVPTGGNAVAILADVTLFEEAGVDLPDDETWTWQDLSDISVELQNNLPDGTFGFAGLAGPAPIIRAFANQTDGGVFTTDGEIQFSIESLTTWFQMQKDFLDAGGSLPADMQGELAAASAGEQMFSQGRAAMQSVWTNQVTAVVGANPNVEAGGEVALLRVPGDSDSANVGTWLNPTLFYGITSSANTPGRQEAAARLLDFLVNDEEAGAITGVDRGVPFNETIADLVVDDLSELDALAVDFMARIAERSGPSIPMPQGGGALFNLNVRFGEEVMFGRMTAEQAAEAWTAELQSALDAAAAAG